MQERLVCFFICFQYTSPSTEVSPEHKLSKPHGFLSNPENVQKKTGILCFSFKFDAADEYSSVKNDFLHVNYAQTDNLPSYAATQPDQDLSGILTKINQDPDQPHSLIPHPHGHFSHKKPVKKSSFQYIIQLPRKNKMIRKINLSRYFPLKLWNTEII